MINRWPKLEEVDEIRAISEDDMKVKAAGNKFPGVTFMEVPTPLGVFCVGATAFGVASVHFPGFDDEEDIEKRMERFGLGWSSYGKKMAFEAGLELMGYLEGEVDKLRCPADFSFLSPFAADVYTALRKIPRGRTVTYGELGDLAGHPKKAMAVGGAMRLNPMPIFVPCHRVTAAKGPGGWSGPKGMKERLLALEGALLTS